MTFAPSRPCKFPLCSALVPAGAGSYCEAHQRQSTVHRQQSDRQRGSAASRGYDATWQRARLGFLSQYPLCPGVLIPTEHWTRPLAEQFHALREHLREEGYLLIFNHEGTKAPSPIHAPAMPSVSSVASCGNWLRQNSIYRIEPWDVAQPATVVDHIIPHRGDPTLMWSPWNWQPLTARAHNRKTGTEQRTVAMLDAARQRGDGASAGIAGASPEPGSEGERVTEAGCPPGGQGNNWQPLTKRAHAKKTAREQRAGFVTGHREGGATGPGPAAAGIGETATEDRPARQTV